MQLDLTHEETLALLNLLTETIEADRYPLSPRIFDAPRHPGEVRADGTGATSGSQTADAGGARPAKAAPFGTAFEVIMRSASGSEYSKTGERSSLTDAADEEGNDTRQS
jgi:hypothetical protein